MRMGRRGSGTSLFGRGVEASVEEELRHHLERMVEENLARGMTVEEAESSALERFGDMRRIQEECVNEDRLSERSRERRDRARGWGHDLKYGVRMLRRSPVYAAVIIVTLAFGIGANAVVFSALSPYFVRALPFEQPDRLAHLFTVNAAAGYDKDRFSLPQYADLVENARGFSGLAAYYYSAVNLSGDDAAEQVTVGRMTANAFDVLGAGPVLGRTFVEGEDGRAGADVVVLGWGLWQRRYAGDPSIVGSTVRLDGVPHTVIGVMGRDFNFPFGGVKAWTPVRTDAALESRDRTQFLVFGRLADGWSRERAAADVESIWRTLSAEYPNEDGLKSGLNVLGMRESLNFAWDVLRTAFVALAGSVLFVLLIACANITGLGIARASSRRREVAVRAALGAPRLRLIRQFLTESSVLALIGGGIGLGLASLVMRFAGPLFPEDLYAIGEFGVDGPAVAFTFGVTVLAALMIGMAPALSVAGTRPGDALREGGRSGAAGVRAGRLRAGLVIGELALGLVLVVGAGLMARSLGRMADAPLGFEPEGLLTIELAAPSATYADAEAYGAYYDRVTDAVRSVAGVVGAANTAYLPLNHETSGINYEVPGQPVSGEALPRGEAFMVSADYFDAMRIPLLAGRGIDAVDENGGERVVVINRAFADRHFDGRDAVGLSVRLSRSDSLYTYRIVGVAENVRHSSMTEEPPPQLYLSIAQSPARRRFIVARAASDAALVAGPLRNAVSAINPDVPANRLRPMDDVVLENIGPFVAMSVVLGVFGGFALLLAAIGLYGLIAYSVTQRLAEFGIRMALGARPADLVRSVVRDGLRLAAAGIVIGLVAALAAGRVLEALLFGVSATDPVTIGLAILVFLASALLAAALPAARASRADPVVALRSD